MKKKNKTWSAEKISMERIFFAVTGRKTKIIDIPPSSDDLGFTSADGKIHLAQEHPVMDGLTEEEKVAFRKGVFCHEMGHQLFTNFTEFEKRLKSLPASQRGIFATIMNVEEDPAIERNLSHEVGGPLYSSLRFTIAHTYKQSPRLEESKAPFSQFISALIQFGDMGLLKGRFTFPEAKKCFANTAEIFERGILEPDPVKRLDIAEEIFEISRPLWQEEADLNELMMELSKMLSESGKSAMAGTGSGKMGEPSEEDDTEGSKGKRRRVTIKEISKEEMEEMEKNGEFSEGPLPEEGDITVFVCKDECEDEGDSDGADSVSMPTEDDESLDFDPEGSTSEGEDGESKNDSSGEKTSKEKKAGSGEGDEGNDEENSEGDSKEGEDGCKKGGKKGDKGDKRDKEGADSESEAGDKESERSQSSASSSENSSDASSDGSCSESSTDDSTEDESVKSPESSSKDVRSFRDKEGSRKDDMMRPTPSDAFEDEGSCEIADEEFEISEEDIASLLEELERIEKDAEEDDKEDSSDIPDFDLSSTKMPSKSCLNYRAELDVVSMEVYERAYAAALENMSGGIKSTTKALKRIFEDDVEEKEYRSSGNISIKKCCSGSLTSQLFEKRIAPANKSDLAVEILVDESGSMSGDDKYVAARECCIALAEIFNNLDIPVYVMGFTADCSGYDIVHAHYITWKNTKKDRMKLLNIAARCNNCDGASIRYATEVLKKKQAKNKLLIVISDGRPSSYNYPNAMEDTRDAVRNAKKHTAVLGVAVGRCRAEEIQFFYEKDFLHIRNVDELFLGISKKMKSIIKYWS